ncbi:DUF4184 family protein [Streptomyces sp. NBC_00335]|uniref:DUF4184 family protein n=1 Tax=unclassified Streptomyces TaxID=2593676 RepID=UPI0022530C26|nr:MULTISPECIES: DUF4184 family protein [unclassified Streptomyces]MCX5407996.1 DUF4184 family protein [Streptomyces sp. NBC_00086]
MPFTLSHAAAVLPAIRRSGRARGPLVGSALVLGSFAPDTLYFVDVVVPGLRPYSTFTHSLPGVLTADAALTAVLAACWLLLREPLIALLPRGRQGRVHAFVRGEEWRGRRLPALALWFYLSAAIGSLTHVVWDAFTHVDRFGTRILPELGEPLALGLPLYSYLQYGTSALAACLLVWFTATALRRLPDSPAPASVPVLGRAEVWGALALVLVCVAVGITWRVLRFFTYFDRIRTPLDIIPTVCFGAGGGLAVGLLLYGILVRLPHRRVRDRSNPNAESDSDADSDSAEKKGTPVPTT